jgi:hypothetical protein
MEVDGHKRTPLQGVGDRRRAKRMRLDGGIPRVAQERRGWATAIAERQRVLATGREAVGYVNSSSCCSGVLVNQSTESVTSLDLSWRKGADEV